MIISVCGYSRVHLRDSSRKTEHTVLGLTRTHHYNGYNQNVTSQSAFREKNQDHIRGSFSY